MAAALPPLSRHQIRTKVFQACYAALTSGSEVEHVFNQLLADDYQALRAYTANQRRAEKGAALVAEDAGEDAIYLRELFFGSLRRQAEHEARLVPLLEHWELARVALIDRILLLMGIEELLHCPDVPIKVTLNEYLDLAREFSTDKSSQFVNGILDKALKQAQAQGLIHKTGRGLLDTAVLS